MMNTDWQDFLTQQHAHIAEGVVQHFGNLDAELKVTGYETVKCDLSQFGTLRVSGEEAQSFLQNLLSNDIRLVDASNAQLSSFNTAKGRMLAVLLIWREGEDYLLQLPTTLTEALRKKLSMYVLRAKVKITDVSNERVTLGISGPSAAERLGSYYQDLPAVDMACVSHEGVNLIRINATRYLLSAPAVQAVKLWSDLGVYPVGSVCWDWLNIRSGIPVVVPKTQEEFVPQMANLDALGGINFKKGCYPGQEIVARMHYLGKLKRRMYLAHIECTEAPQVGEALFSADMEGQPSGMIANVAPSPNGGYDLLAVLQTASVDTHPIHTQAGVALEILPLPYTLS